MWYSVRLLFKSTIKDALDHEPFYEEKVLVIHTKEEDPPNVITEKAKEHEHSYQNEDKEIVEWLFHQILEVESLGENLKSGDEVYSKVYRCLEDIDDASL